MRAGRGADRREAARRRPPPHGLAFGPAHRAAAAARGRGARARRGSRRHLRRRRRPRRADRDDPGRGRAAVPVRRPVPRAQAATAEGDPAVRASRLRQDAHRQGGGELAGAPRRREDRQPRSALLLPQHQGPRAPQQVRRRDRAPDPLDLPACPGEVRRGQARHRVLRRDGLAVPHPGHRHLVRHREHDRAAAPRRDRRRREPEERHRDRGVEPRGPHRPRDPATRPSRREDQDRAPRRGERRARSSPSTSRPTCRSPTKRRRATASRSRPSSR